MDAELIVVLVVVFTPIVVLTPCCIWIDAKIRRNRRLTAQEKG
jgi:hypothetical protein